MGPKRVYNDPGYDHLCPDGEISLAGTGKADGRRPLAEAALLDDLLERALKSSQLLIVQSPDE